LWHTVSAEDSSSFANVGEGAFSISYVDGSSSKGDYITEVFEIGSASLQNMTMGLGLHTNIPYGLVGVGYALNEAIVADTSSASSAYANLPVLLQQEGLIPTIAYSLWLNDLQASTGNIMFGGINTDKYQGDLSRINIYKDSRSQAFTSFTVAMTSLDAVSDSGSDTLTSEQFPIPVVLDSGTTLSYLPTDLAEQIWKEVGAGYAESLGVAVVPCSLATGAGYFSFGLGGSGGPVINVTMDELVLPLVVDGEDPPKIQSGPNAGEDACHIGIQNSTSSPYLLGDTFLRSAYVVYDLVNNEIGIAPTDFNATTSNVVPFPSQGAPIPSSSAAPNQADIAEPDKLSTPTYGASNGFQKEASAVMVPALGWPGIIVVGITTASFLFGNVLVLF
jgi:hypothetical protein